MSTSFKATADVPFTKPVGKAEVLEFVASACHTPEPASFKA
ncbi:MAG: hypothetical protein ABI638_06550 [Ignavibacteriota bacterium]